LFRLHVLAGAPQRRRPPRRAACWCCRPCVHPSALDRSRVWPASCHCNPRAKSSPLARVRLTPVSSPPRATARRRASAAYTSRGVPHRRQSSDLDRAAIQIRSDRGQPANHNGQPSYARLFCIKVLQFHRITSMSFRV
jgi:hypothetical protein